MKRVQPILRDLFPSLQSTLVSAVIGLSAGSAVYLGELQRHFFSKRYLVYALLIAAAVMLLAAWLRGRFLTSRYKALDKKMRFLLLFSALAFSLILLANTQIQPLYYLLPDSQLKIRIPIGDVPAGQESVRLLWVETGQGTVYYQNMQLDGKWERVAKNVVFAPNQEVTITWSGKAGLHPEVAFRTTAYDQPVFISWNGAETEYNLRQPYVIDDALQSKYAIPPVYRANLPNQSEIIIKDRLDIPFIYNFPFILAFTISTGFAFFALLLLLGSWEVAAKEKRKSSRYAWLWYALPMILAWSFTLLVFWPGIMTNDSMALWKQNLSGIYSDWQSALYALALAGLMKVWYSPALVAILQIIALALLTAWGLKTLEEHGSPRLPLWIASFLFALSPINNQYVITLWRDIPYAMAVMWLTILVMKLVFSRGESSQGAGWVWLGLAGFLIAILRQNGIPVAFVMLLALPVIYRDNWKRLTGSLVLCLLLFAFVKGPLYSWVDVDRTKSGQSNLILLHHIAAHLKAGTPLEPAEKEYLDSFLPVDKWNYYCCYVGTISYDENFQREKFLSSSSANRKLALDLFLRDPAVDIRHTLCAGELTWRYNNNQCYMKSIHGFNSWAPGQTSWIIINDVGLQTDSRLPSLVQPYVDMLRVFGFRDDFLVIYLRPALYLYLACFSVAALTIRRKDLRILLVLAPILIQSAILFLVSYAPAVRYQYSIYLACVLLVCSLFVPASDPKKG